MSSSLFKAVGVLSLNNDKLQSNVTVQFKLVQSAVSFYSGLTLRNLSQTLILADLLIERMILITIAYLGLLIAPLCLNKFVNQLPA